MKLELVGTGPVPGTLDPPGNGAIPKVPERLPVLCSERKALRSMVDGALTVRLGDEDMDTICYLLRRAHGMGITEGRTRNG